MMLARVADSLYWIGRYLERAEHLSRLSDVMLNATLDHTEAAGQAAHIALSAVGQILPGWSMGWAAAGPRRRRRSSSMPLAAIRTRRPTLCSKACGASSCARTTSTASPRSCTRARSMCWGR